MKRLFTMLSAVLIIFGGFPLFASAKAESISACYVPKTQRGTLFYIDIYSGTSIGAAILEVGYDDAIAEFSDVSCESPEGAAEAHAENSIVTIAYTNREPSGDKLCRLSFKALKTGTVDFTVTVTQAVDDDLGYLSDLSPCTLSVKLGTVDIPTASSSVTKTSGSSTSKRSYSGSKSSVTATDDAEAADMTETAGTSLDLSGQHKSTYFLLGGAAAILLCLVILAAYLLIKLTKKKPTKEIPAEESENDNSQTDD